jgi:hypothetical protein
MTQVLENRADLEGQLMACRADERPGLQCATLAVDDVQAVAPYPNLLASATGRSLDILVPDAIGALTPGVRLALRVKRTSRTTVFAETCTVVETAH